MLKLINHRIIVINDNLYIPITELASWKIDYDYSSYTSGDREDHNYSYTIYVDILLKSGFKYDKIEVGSVYVLISDYFKLTKKEKDIIDENYDSYDDGVRFEFKDKYEKARSKAFDVAIKELDRQVKELVDDFAKADDDYQKNVQDQAFRLLLANNLIKKNT